MTPRDVRLYLHDIVEAGRRVSRALADKDYSAYESDPDLQSVVERQLITVGEALSQAARQAPELARAVPDVPQIVGLRNILVHAYPDVDPAVIWTVAVQDMPRLAEIAAALLERDA